MVGQFYLDQLSIDYYYKLALNVNMFILLKRGETFGKLQHHKGGTYMPEGRDLSHGQEGYGNQFLYRGRNLWGGFLFGLGLVGFIDETVFHQLLHWHHFYDKSTTDIGLVSDGIFHAFSWFATIGSSFMLADLHRRHAFWLKRWVGGLFLGAGSFQLYDGVVQHKLMKLHQIRYNVDITLYDAVWNITAFAMIVVGFVLLVRNSFGQQEKGELDAR